MGISGLLMNTKSIGRRKSLSEYRNARLGIDGYSWLHKSLYHCAIEVAIQKNLYKIVRYFEKNLKCMLSLNIKVIIIFDGDQLPLKALNEANRHENRQKNFDMAMHHYHSGRHEEANKLFAQAIDVTPGMAFFVKTKLEELFPNKLEFFVAPYEADSQLAYLSKIGYIDVVVTEDSDLLVFGARKMFYKMDKDFYGVEVELSRLSECNEFSFRGWTHDKFIHFCILAGCDYLTSPKGIAFKKAYFYISKYGSIDKIINILSEKLEKDYEEKFLCAYLAFKYQRVFCPFKKQIVNLNSFKLEELSIVNSFDFYAAKKCLLYYGSLDFLGKDMDSKTALNLAHCKIDPITKTSFLKTTNFGFTSDKKSREGLKLNKKMIEAKYEEFLEELKDFDKNESSKNGFFTITRMDEEKKDRDGTQELLFEVDDQVKFDGRSIQINQDLLIEQNDQELTVPNSFLGMNQIAQNSCDVYKDSITKMLERFKYENALRKPNLNKVLNIFVSQLNKDTD